ncbi:MAG: hypothetical protein ABIP12_04545 [Terriglobales bacterium]
MSMVSNGRGPKVLQFHRSAARPQAINSIEHKDFAADIFHNRNLRPPTWHFILTRTDNDEILYWGQESSVQRAEDAARAMLNTLAAAEAG